MKKCANCGRKAVFMVHSFFRSVAFNSDLGSCAQCLPRIVRDEDKAKPRTITVTVLKS